MPRKFWMHSYPYQAWRYCSLLLLKNLFRQRDGGHRLGPSAVESQMRDGLDEFGLSDAVLLARCRWNGSCSELPPAMSAATVTRLRSRFDSSARSQTSPNRTSSVSCTNLGERSPKFFLIAEGSLFISFAPWDADGRLPYCSSLTFSIQSTFLPLSTSCIAIYVM